MDTINSDFSSHDDILSEEEQGDILSMCHSSTCGGHFAARKTSDKILQSSFYWPTIFKDAHCFYTECL